MGKSKKSVRPKPTQEKQAASGKQAASAPAVPAEQNAFALLSKYRSAVMGFAALWILVFHEWWYLTSEPESGFDFWYFLEGHIKRIGFCGVDIFLLLSGIGLTFAIRRGSLVQFYYRRLRRIILPFVIMAVICRFTEDWTRVQFWGNVTGWNFYAKSMYSFLWFVPAIVTLYLLFPLYWKLFGKADSKVLFTVWAIMIWLLMTMILRSTLRADLFGFTNRIPVFLVGVLYGWMTQNRKDIRFTAETWAYVATACVLGFYLAHLANFKGVALIVPTSNCCIPNLLISMSLPLLMAKGLSLLENSRALHWLGIGLNKVLAFFGGFSLELYCVQEWFGRQFTYKLPDHHNMLLRNVMLFAAIFLAAWLGAVAIRWFWKGLEWLAGKAAKGLRKAAPES